MQSLENISLEELIISLRDGELSSREVVQFFIDRIDQLEPHLHAWITLTPDRALSQATHADKQFQQLRNGTISELPPMLGVPIGIKDILCLEGVRCTCGSRILEDFTPVFTATAVYRLLEAGGISLGKTNTDEFAMGSSTENSAFGPTRNPWSFERVPGGSSGGSAAAVAAGMTPIALGTDTGGSVRQPASFCGITGIKPTYGRISRYGLIAYGSSLDTIGVFGRAAADVARIFTIMAGGDPLDSTSVDVQVPNIIFQNDPRKTFSGLRIGIPKEYFIEGMQPEVESGINLAIKAMEDMGAHIFHVSLPHTQYAVPVYYLIASAEASANLARYDSVRYGPRAACENLEEMFFKTRGENFGAEVKRRIMLGTYALSAGYYDEYYTRAQKVRTLIKADFEDAFQIVDVIAAPVTPTTAFRFGEHTDDPLAMYLEDVFTLPANLAGIPALSFPVGFDQEQLPIGMQLMAPNFFEERLFQASHAYQMITEWHNQVPPKLDTLLH